MELNQELLDALLLRIKDDKDPMTVEQAPQPYQDKLKELLAN